MESEANRGAAARAVGSVRDCTSRSVTTSRVMGAVHNVALGLDTVATRRRLLPGLAALEATER